VRAARKCCVASATVSSYDNSSHWPSPELLAYSMSNSDAVCVCGIVICRDMLKSDSALVRIEELDMVSESSLARMAVFIIRYN
jgi:hypothetical protein